MPNLLLYLLTDCEFLGFFFLGGNRGARLCGLRRFVGGYFTQRSFLERFRLVNHCRFFFGGLKLFIGLLQTRDGRG